MKDYHNSGTIVKSPPLIKPMFVQKLLRPTPLLLLVALLLSLQVGRKLSYKMSPQLMFHEVHGMHSFLELEDLCNPDPRGGLEEGYDNVAGYRSSSLLYAVPNKLLKPSLDLFSLHRAMSLLFYLAFLLILILLSKALALEGITALFLLVYLGMNEQVLETVFELRLTTSAYLWLSWVLLLFAIIEKRIKQKQDDIAVLIALVPITMALSYETYAVARPLALVCWSVATCWILFANIERRKTLLAVFIGASLASILLLKLAHPQLRFDWSLFNARGESLVSQGVSTTSSLNHIVLRAQELLAVLTWPYHSSFSQDRFRPIGWLEIILALCVLTPLVYWRHKQSGENYKSSKLSDKSWTLALLCVLGITSLAIPLLATTAVRGGRLFGFYLTSTLLAAILLQATLETKLRPLLSAALLFASLAMFGNQASAIKNWESQNTSPEFAHYHFDLVAALREYRLPETAKANNTGTPSSTVYLCDEFPGHPLGGPKVGHYHWHLRYSWHSALFVSDFACQSEFQNLEFQHWSEKHERCPCTLDRNGDRSENGLSNLPAQCLVRTATPGNTILEWQPGSN